MQVIKGKYYRVIMGLWVSFASLVLLIILYFVAVAYNWFGWFGDIPSLSELENPRNELASEVYSADNVLMGKYYRENRTPVKYEELSPYLVNALIATEDIRFEEHSGIDAYAMIRAIIKLGRDGGGSTISQQLAKNLFRMRKEESQGSLTKTPILGILITKSKEWLTAIMIERNYTKREIIEMYLNTVEFGSNAFGISTAARTFFDKHPSQLNVQESATLVGLLKAPSYYSPISNPKNSKNRRNTVMEQMQKYNFLSASECENLKRTPIELHYGVEDHISGMAPYFRVELQKFLLKWAQENKRDLYKDGLRIYTTLDSKLQRFAEESVREHLEKFQGIFLDYWKGRKPWVNEWNKEIPGFLEKEARKTERYKIMVKENGGSEAEFYKIMRKPTRMRVYAYKHGNFYEKDTLMSPLDSIGYYKHFLQSGFMVMEPQSGHIKAWVGGINFKHFKYDHVHQGKRQPGSTFKPIIYAMALDNSYTPCTQIVDQPVVFGGGWTPRNANLAWSYSPMSLRAGIATSTNSIVAQLIKNLGTKMAIEYSRDLGITSPLDSSATICLGTSSVNIYELLGVYSTFANKGKHTEPVYITRIEDRYGNLIHEFVPKVHQAISEEVAYQMTYMMQGSCDGSVPGATSVALGQYGIGNNNEIACKTGTTQWNADAWFMGYTRNLAAGVWVGGDTWATRFETIVWGQGAVLALPVWGRFFQKVYNDPEMSKRYPKGAFEKPEEMTVELDCAKMQAERQKLYQGIED
ncbi:MAG: transglycosylase domain-containing protein [Microscillaceae bacterium]|jgi:penicillin-binding protein 1A|nr:transglycosylase domain-containing protein [Microscillaceae bacterium]